MVPWYQLRLLGSFQLIHEGEAAGFRSEKERALLAYLAMEADRPHSREALASLLWPELSADTAHNNLRVTLHRLRHLLGEPGPGHLLLEVSREAVQLAKPSELLIDATTFQALLARAEQHDHTKLGTCPACMAWYAEAATLYRGEFLEGVYPADSPAFSEWALLKREYLDGQALRVLYILTAYHQRRGELDLALQYAQRQLELEPWREEAYCQVMAILAVRGEHSAALRQYERCRQVLREELGVEPAQETRALHQRLLAARKRRRHNLPPESTPFIGRRSELSQVAEFLSDPDCRLLTLLGPGGIGKSRLAIRAAQAQVYTHLEGVCLVPLAGIAMAQDMLRAIAGALELHFPPGVNPESQMLDYLRQKEILLVLDNFEQLLGPGESTAARALEGLLESAPELRILVTSRQRLNLNREWIFVLEGLSFPTEISDGRAEESEAAQLFLQCVRRSDPNFLPDEEDLAAIVRICRLLEGVPLAIELAAAWTRVMTPGQIALEIQKSLDFLASSSPAFPERQRSLGATFEHSYRLLTTQERQVLGKLSIFPHSFDRVAAEQVAGASLATLASLSDHSLLTRASSKQNGSHTRYRMHQLIRQFSGEKLGRDPGEAENTRDRHRAYYMGFLNARNRDVMGGTASYQAVEAVAGEMENIRPALQRAIDQGCLDELGGSLNILMCYYEIRGLFDEAERVFARIRQSIEDGIESGHVRKEHGEHYLARAMLYHGWYCMHLARFDEAIDLNEKGLSLSVESGDHEGHALALNSLGLLALNQGRYQTAEENLHAALEVDTQQGYIWGEAGALGNLGHLALLAGDLTVAGELFQKGLALFTQLNDLWGMAVSLNGLGDVALQQGNLERAEQSFSQALEIRRKLNQRWREALSLNGLAGVAVRRQDYAEAKDNYQNSLALLRDFGEKLHLASTLSRYAEVCTALGENAAARESLRESLRLARETSAEGTIQQALLGIAALLANEGEKERATQILSAIPERAPLDDKDGMRAANLLAGLEGSLSPHGVSALREREETTTLEDLIESLLRTDW
jgi:predicted ATPase/DNA-binding SARP family transcriptional activator/Tfp pilus assembly protein PilF